MGKLETRTFKCVDCGASMSTLADEGVNPDQFLLDGKPMNCSNCGSTRWIRTDRLNHQDKDSQ